MSAALLSAPAALDGATVVLHPGDLAVVDRGDTLQTLLGSCISIALADRRRSIGAMCHFVHAGPPPAHGGTAYAGPALDALYTRLRRRGIDARQCDAWLIGGGDLLRPQIAATTVGAANIRWALAFAARERLVVRGHWLGGPVYRKVSWKVGDAAPRVIEVALD